MLEGKALVIAIMMLTAAPIAATDSGQIIIGDVRDNFEDMLANDEPTKVSEIIDDSKLDENDIAERDLLSTEDSDIPCFTFEEWKDQVVTDRADFVKEDGREKSDEKEGARNSDDTATEDNNDLVSDRKEFAKNDDCLTSEEWTLKFESDEDKEEPCFTFEDLEKKVKDERKSHKNFWGRDKDWDREEKDWNGEWIEELELLVETCKDGDEEACEDLLAIREELAEDHEEEERDDDDDGARGGNNDSDDEDVADDHNHVTDRDEESWEEIRAVIQELAEACEDGNEEACAELREMVTELMNDKEGDRKEKGWDNTACLTMKEWKKVFSDGKDRKENRDRDDDRKERGSHRDAIVREMLAELEAACGEGNEEACEGLEVMLAELEEIEGDCDKERDEEERDDGESDEEEDYENDEEESDEDNESDEDDSEE